MVKIKTERKRKEATPAHALTHTRTRNMTDRQTRQQRAGGGKGDSICILTSGIHKVQALDARTLAGPIRNLLPSPLLREGKAGTLATPNSWTLGLRPSPLRFLPPDSGSTKAGSPNRANQAGADFYIFLPPPLRPSIAELLSAPKLCGEDTALRFTITVLHHK